MNYQRIYEAFIQDRRGKQPTAPAYFETHHVLPRSMGGSDDQSNLIRLSAEDHFFAHLLLAKAHGGKMWYALNAMTMGNIGKRSACSGYLNRVRKIIAKAREEAAKIHSAKMKGYFAGEKHPMYGKPCSELAKHKTRERHAAGFNPMASPEARAKLSAALKGMPKDEQWRRNISLGKIGKPLSEATRQKMSASRTGKRMSADVVEKVRLANTGKKRTPEQVEAMRQRLTGRALSPEHVAKIKEINAQRDRPISFAGHTHSQSTKERMAKVNQAKKAYCAIHGGSPKYVTIQMIEQAGLAI